MKNGFRAVAMGESEYRWLQKGLKGLGFFARLELKHLAGILPYMTLTRWPARHTVCREGTAGNSFYLIYRGRVEVRKRGWTRPVAVLKAGQFFGEMALLFRQPRTATVRTLSGSRIFMLRASDFEKMLKKNPSVARTIKSVAESRRQELARLT